MDITVPQLDPEVLKGSCTSHTLPCGESPHLTINLIPEPGEPALVSYEAPGGLLRIGRDRNSYFDVYICHKYLNHETGD